MQSIAADSRATICGTEPGSGWLSKIALSTTCKKRGAIYLIEELLPNFFVMLSAVLFARGAAFRVCVGRAKCVGIFWVRLCAY
jgi:hypothetical protein